MPRPRRRSATALSLFPFLSVLACIIGTLTLLITATAIGEIGHEAVDEDAHAERLVANQQSRAELERLEALAAEVTRLETEQSTATSRRNALRSEREALGARPDRVAPLQARLTRTEARVTALRSELEEQIASQSELERQVEVRRRARAQSPIALEPSGSGRDLAPHFIECRRDEIILYEEPDRRPSRVPAHRIATSLDVRHFLSRVRATPGASAILLNRPSGVASCRAVEQQAGLHRARHGRMPIPEVGELDFSRIPKSQGSS